MQNNINTSKKIIKRNNIPKEASSFRKRKRGVEYRIPALHVKKKKKKKTCQNQKKNGKEQQKERQILPTTTKIQPNPTNKTPPSCLLMKTKTLYTTTTTRLNEMTETSLELKSIFNEKMKLIFRDSLGIPNELICIIESYYNTYEYLLKTCELPRFINFNEIAKEICNLFLHSVNNYLSLSEQNKLFFFHTNKKNNKKEDSEEDLYINYYYQNSYTLEIRPDQDYCYGGISVYRIVIQKEEIPALLTDWKKWKGETKNSICDCYFKNKSGRQLINMIKTGAGIRYTHLWDEIPDDSDVEKQEEPSSISFFNPYLRLIDLLGSFFQVMKKKK